MFEPEACGLEGGSADPFMEEDVMAIMERHKAIQQAWKIPPHERLTVIRQQLLELVDSRAVQTHLGRTIDCVGEGQAEEYTVRQSATAHEIVYSERNIRKAFAQLQELEASYPTHDYGGSAEDEEEEQEPQPVRVATPKRAEHAETEEDKKVRTNVEAVNEILSELEWAEESQRGALMRRLAEKWMISWEWADGNPDVNRERRCRILFVGHSLRKQEIKETTLFSSYSEATDMVDAFERAGIARSEMAAMVAVPLFHSNEWGEYNNPPAVVIRLFSMYTRAIFSALRPSYIITSTKYGTELVQRFFDLEARAPEEWAPNHMDAIKISKEYKPFLLRLLHPMQVRDETEDGRQKAEERDAAIARLAKKASPIKRVRSLNDVLMGKAQDSDVAGGLVWNMDNSVGIVVFPTEDEVAQIMRAPITVILNCAPRAVKWPGKRAWKGKEIKVQIDANSIELVYTLLNVLANLERRERILICCPTGVRHSLVVLAMIRILLTAPYVPLQDIITWCESIRATRIRYDDAHLLDGFYEMVRSIIPFPAEAVDTKKNHSLGVYLERPEKEKLVLSRCHSMRHAELVKKEMEGFFAEKGLDGWNVRFQPWSGSEKLVTSKRWDRIFRKAEKISGEPPRKKKKKSKKKH